MSKCFCDAGVPKLSIYKKMEFVEKLPKLNLYQIEERLVVLRISFLQVWDLPCAGQKLVHGDTVNVPVDIALTVHVLLKKYYHHR